MGAKYVHTNLIARDWKRLAEFYVEVFGCTYVYPERDLSGAWLDDLTGIRDASIKGIHLALPGYESGGPTLEIFRYAHNEVHEKRINGEGFGHIAFLVDDVEVYLSKVLEHGGSVVGKTVGGDVAGAGKIHLVYARDPEGNIIEIQKWE